MRLFSQLFGLLLLSQAFGAPTCPVSPSIGVNMKNVGFPALVNFVTEGVCRIKETSLNPTAASGYFTFKPGANNPNVEPGDGATTLQTDYRVTGLTDGDHKFHVHNYGDNFSPDGASVENHFVGTTNTRPAGGPQEVGLLNDGSPVQNTDGTGVAVGGFPDEAADLTGRNSILGRAIIIHYTTPNVDPLTKAAICIIGWSNDDGASQVRETNAITKAHCGLEPTIPPAGGPPTTPLINGDVTFEVNEWGTVDVKVFASGAPSGTYSIQVNTAGDISEADASLQEGVFTGTPKFSLAGRTAVGQVGVSASLGTGTFTPNGNNIIRAFFVDAEADLTGRNSIIGRGLTLIKDGNTVAQCVVGIARDSTFIDPPQPANVPGTISEPIVTEAIARLYPVASGIKDGYVEMKVLAASDPLYPGVRVRYHVVGVAANSWHSFQIRQFGSFGTSGPGSSSNTDAGMLFNGAVSGRETTLVDSVGLVYDNATFVADAQGVLKGEFTDRSLWLNDYNSIIGRSFAVMSGIGSVNPGNVIGVGVIGRKRESTSDRTWPANRPTSAECWLQGSITGRMVITENAGGIIINPDDAIGGGAFPANTAIGIAPQGDVFDTKGLSAGYLFRGFGISRGDGCANQYAGNGGNPLAPTSNTVISGVFLGGANSIIGRTIFLTDGVNDYTTTSNAAGVNRNEIRAASCVVGVLTENAITVTGGSIHPLPSVMTTIPNDDGGIPNIFSGASAAAATLSTLAMLLLACLLLV